MQRYRTITAATFFHSVDQLKPIEAVSSDSQIRSYFFW
jgi:hypothetical protein